MQKTDLRIVFMGTPEFAVQTLAALVEGGYNVVAVVTQPDKPVGRHGSVLQAPAVKRYAMEKGLPVLQPEKMKDPEFIETLRSYNANLQVVVAFRMLPEVVWAMPEYGTFNVHAALLPAYRGAAPINWAIINGEKTTGVTTFFLDHDIDTGRVIMQKPLEIGDNDNVETVYDGLMNLGAELCIDTVDRIIATDGHPETIAQDDMPTIKAHQKAAPKLFKDNCRIDWSRGPKAVHDFVRGLSPIPGAWTMLTDDKGKTSELKIYATQLPAPCSLLPTLSPLPTPTLEATKKQLFVRFPDGLLEITELQPAGKKRMPARDFVNGLRDTTVTLL